MARNFCREGIGFAFLLLLVLGANAQKITSDFFIRNYASSLSIKMSSEKEMQVLYGEYGKTKLFALSETMRYMYQSQEYDIDFNFYYFPARIYYPDKKRFLNPDPKEQYFSPYLYVGGDPVNIMDRDGMEGVPLVIHGSGNRFGVNTFAEDLKTQMPDAHFISYDNFLRGNFGNVPKLNGNIYLEGDIKQAVEPLFHVSSTDEIPGKVMHGKGLNVFKEGREFRSYVSAKDFGGDLYKFVQGHNVPLKNIIVPGTGGEGAAYMVGKGIASQAVLENDSKMFSRRFTTHGLKRAYASTIFGNHRAEEVVMKKQIEPFATQLHVFPKEVNERRVRSMRTGRNTARLDYVAYTGPGADGRWIRPEVASGQEINRMMEEGRAPGSMNNFFSEVSHLY